jgi:RNA polymerase sigma factor (sigma-70 family)
MGRDRAAARPRRSRDADRDRPGLERAERAGGWSVNQRIPGEVAAQVARLFVEEAPAVFRTALRAVRGDRAEAEDLVQKAFQAAAEQWATIVDCLPARKRAWLRRVAINKAIDSYLAASRVEPGAYPEDTASQSPSAGQVALTRMQADRCLKAIREMPEMRSKVAYLKFHEEWANREIAEYLGISAGAVGKHVSDARADLKRALPEMTFTDDRDGEPDADAEEAP